MYLVYFRLKMFTNWILGITGYKVIAFKRPRSVISIAPPRWQWPTINSNLETFIRSLMWKILSFFKVYTRSILIIPICVPPVKMSKSLLYIETTIKKN